MALDFPASPTVGQQFSAAGVTWVWDGTKWVASGLSVAYLPLAGGSMSGPIVLAADPAAAMQAATKQYVDGVRYGDNRIINGDCRIDQRWNGVSGTASGYTVDRWQYQGLQANKLTWGRNLNAVASLPVTGCPYYLGFQSSSAYTLLVGDFFYFSQLIEADMVSDFSWGNLGGQQPVTLSFWAYSSLTGNFGGAVRAATGARSYPFQYSLPVANTWTKIIINIPGSVLTGWTMSGNAAAIDLRFNLGTGSNFLGPPGVWATVAYGGSIGDNSIVSVNAATFYITGVKLEIGNVATPYNRQSLAKSLADCQRYFWQFNGPQTTAVGYYSSATNAYGYIKYPVTMRAAPTISVDVAGAFNVASPSAGSLASTAVVGVNLGVDSGQLQFTTAAATAAQPCIGVLTTSHFLQGNVEF